MNKKIIPLFLILALMISGCNNTLPVADVSDSPGPDPDTLSVTSLIGETGSETEYCDLSSYLLNDIARSFMALSAQDFCAGYPEPMLFERGIIPSTAISPFMLDWAEGAVDVGRYLGLVFDARFEGPVLGDISIGSTMDEVVSVLGEPQFEHQEYQLIGYKTKDYYIAFRGLDKVERVYLEKRFPMPDSLKDMLLTPPASWPDGGAAALENSVYFNTYVTRGPSNVTGYNFGLILDGYLEEGVPCVPSIIWADWEGALPTGFDESCVMDLDFAQQRILDQCAWEGYLEDGFASGAVSPDGSTVAFGTRNTNYEQAKIWFRYLDGSKPDEFTQLSFTSDLLWLNNRYLLINVHLYGPQIYDVQEHEKILFGWEDDMEFLGELKYTHVDFEQQIIYIQEFEEEFCQISYVLDDDVLIINREQ